MRLNQYVRQAIILNILQDVPKEDFDTLIADEQRKLGLCNVPEALRTAIERDPSCLSWINGYQQRLEITVDMPGGDKHTFSQWIYCIGHIETAELDKIARLKDLCGRRYLQQEKRNALHRELTAALNSVQTTKRFVELYPQFAKYVPKDEKQATANLPATTNLMSVLTAAGWPKDKPQAEPAQQPEEALA